MFSLPFSPPDGATVAVMELSNMGKLPPLVLLRVSSEVLLVSFRVFGGRWVAGLRLVEHHWSGSPCGRGSPEGSFKTKLLTLLENIRNYILTISSYPKIHLLLSICT